jgi:hypothetical protein
MMKPLMAFNDYERVGHSFALPRPCDHHRRSQCLVLAESVEKVESNATTKTVAEINSERAPARKAFVVKLGRSPRGTDYVGAVPHVPLRQTHQRSSENGLATKAFFNRIGPSRQFARRRDVSAVGGRPEVLG